MFVILPGGGVHDDAWGPTTILVLDCWVARLDWRDEPHGPDQFETAAKARCRSAKQDERYRPAILSLKSGIVCPSLYVWPANKRPAARVALLSKDSANASTSHKVMSKKSPGRTARAMVNEAYILGPVCPETASGEFLIDDRIFSGPHVFWKPTY
jgi:hypothetical protein